MTFEFDTDEGYENEFDFLADLDDALRDLVVGTSWQEQVRALTPETPIEERVALYQAIRRSNLLPNEVTFFLIAWSIEQIANDRAAELLESQYEQRLAEMEDRFGLDEHAINHLEQTPPEYQALHMEFAQATQSLFVATFQAFGEHKMASLLRRTADEFDRLYNAGYEALLGPSDETRMQELMNMETND